MRAFFLLAFALTLSGCAKKPDPVASARRFFERIAAGDARGAYQDSAFGFQAQRNAAAFEGAAKEMGLAEYVGAEWEPAAIERQTAKVTARLKTRSGKEIPLLITLTDETGAWRVYSLRSPPSETTGVSENRFTLVGKAPALTGAVIQPVPPDDELRALVRDNLLRFNEAIREQSFDAFYDSVSSKWQDQLTKGQLQRAFQPFIDKRVDLSGLQHLDCTFDVSPEVGADGLLTVIGDYATKPYKVHFSLKFFYELPVWKLFGVDVSLQK